MNYVLNQPATALEANLVRNSASGDILTLKSGNVSVSIPVAEILTYINEQETAKATVKPEEQAVPVEETK